ncbi:MAG: hypothetical protein ACLQME_04770 [Alphaproteobacteria bacterium]
MTPTRIKTLTSYRAHAQFLAECEDGMFGYLARVQVDDLKTPYAHSPTIAIKSWQGRPIICLETAHRRYEVFTISPDFLRFKTEPEAEAWHMSHRKRTPAELAQAWGIGATTA